MKFYSIIFLSLATAGCVPTMLAGGDTRILEDGGPEISIDSGTPIADAGPGRPDAGEPQPNEDAGSGPITDAGPGEPEDAGMEEPVCMPDGPSYFMESGGIIVIEAESTESALGEWTVETTIGDYAGSGHLRFNGNQFTNGPAKDPLVYRFQVSQSGTYQPLFRAKNGTQSAVDHSNDCFIRLEGDFTAGADSANTNQLMTDTKFFTSVSDGWQWAWGKRLDFNGQKDFARYQLIAGETYTFVMSGRSKDWSVDQIAFIEDDVNLNGFRNNPQTESDVQTDMICE